MPDLTIDTERLARQGFPEVVFARGKTPEQTLEALRQLYAAHGHALASGVDAITARLVHEALGSGEYDAGSKLYRIGQLAPLNHSLRPLVISAGTSDQPVAEEAAQTLEYLGHKPARIADVGVAGLHRLLACLDDLRQASVIIVVAGMEGALASVVGGLVAMPVIAVPTSVGYGASYEGIAALLSMLNSCAAGVAVMNIDNGFGAAIHAHRILTNHDR